MAINNLERLIIDETSGEGPSINFNDLDQAFVDYLVAAGHYDDVNAQWNTTFSPDADNTDPRLAESGDSYITISTAVTASLDSVQLSDVNGDAFDGTQSSGLSTTTGGAINLTSADGGSAVLGIDSSDGSLAFIVYLVETGTNTDGDPTYGVQMVQFEAIASDTATSADEAMFLDALHVSSSASTIIDFGQAPSQNVLWIAFGADNSDLQVIATGRNPDYDKVPSGDRVNTSQGGIFDATLGSNKQGLTSPDAIYFSYVTGYLDPADGYSPIAGDYRNANDFKDESLLTFNEMFNTDSASILISQVVSGATAEMQLTAMTTDAEETTAFFEGLGLGSTADAQDEDGTGEIDTMVEIDAVKVVDFFDPTRVFASTDPSEVTDTSITVTVSIDGNGVATISGFEAGMQVIFETDGLHNRVKMEATGGNWDPGGFGFSNVDTDQQQLQIEMQDDGPSITVAQNANADFSLVQGDLDETFGAVDNENEALEPVAEDANDDSDDDDVAATATYSTAPLATEAIGAVTTDAGDVAQLFATTTLAFGADGPKNGSPASARSDTLSFDDFGDPIATTLSATATGDLAGASAADRALYLTWVSATQIDVVTNPDADGYVILQIDLTNSTDLATAALTYRQFAAVENNDTDLHDAIDSLFTTVDTDALKLTLKSVVTDGDLDTKSSSVSVTLIDDDETVVRIGDDGPNLDISVKSSVALTTLAANLDETIGATDTLATNETADNDSGSDEPADPPAIGQKSTQPGAIAAFFQTDTAAYGTDGKLATAPGAERSDSLGFVDFGDPLETTLSATATGDLAEADAADRKLYLVHDSATLITVRAGGALGPVVLSITLEDPTDLTAATLTYRQILPVEHDKTTLFDDVAQLLTQQTGEKLELALTSTITDGDGDTATDVAKITLIDTSTSVMSVDDDGPVISATHNTNALLVHDETAGIQSAGSDDDIASTADIVALFDGVSNKGVDADLATGTDDAGAIGFAGPETLVTLNAAGTDAGTDGEASRSFAWVLNSSASGLKTTEGVDIVLSLQDGVLVGRTDDASATAAFAVSLDPDSGESYVAQWLSLEHTDPDPTKTDEVSFIAKGAVSIKVSLVDNDGDTVSKVFAVSDQIGFADDGPSVTLGAPSGSISHELDETVLLPAGDGDDTYATGETESGPTTSSNGDIDDVSGTPFGRLTTSVAGLKALFATPNVKFGSDGAGTLGTNGVSDGLSLVLSTDGVMTNLTATETGAGLADRTIYLFETTTQGVIEGRVGGASGPVAIKISLDASGLTTEQFLPLEHGNTAIYDENIVMSLASGETLKLRYDVKVQDGDGDTDTASSTVTLVDENGGYASFDDDGPVLAIDVKTATLSHDEQPDIQTGDVDYDNLVPTAVRDLFDAVTNPGTDSDADTLDTNGAIGYAGGVALTSVNLSGTDAGQDGQKSLLHTLKVGNAAGASGLKTTDGADIVLFKEGSVIVGRVGDATGVAAFALAIDTATGEVFMAQWLSVAHTGDDDTSLTLAAGSLMVVATLTDNDGDVAVASKDVSVKVTFIDDDPTLGVIGDLGDTTPIAFETNDGITSGDFDWYAGSDGGAIAFTDWQVGDATDPTGLITDQTFPSDWIASFGAITGTISTDGSTITFSGDDADNGGAIFSVSLNDASVTDGTASYTLEVFKDAPIKLDPIDLSGFPSGKPIEIITLGTATGSTFVEFDGILWTGDFTGSDTNFDNLASYVVDFDNFENRNSTPEDTFEKQDNLNRDKNGFGVFSDGSALMNEFEGMKTTFKADAGSGAEIVSGTGIQFVVNQNGGTNDVIITVVVQDTLNGDITQEIHSVEIDPLTKGGQAAVDAFTIVTADLEFALDYDGDGTVEGADGESGLIVLDGMDEFDTVYYLYTFPNAGSNDGVRIKEVNVLNPEFLSDIRLDLTVQGTDGDLDETTAQDFSIFIDANDNDTFDF